MEIPKINSLVSFCDKGDFLLYTTRGRCITILYNAIKNKVATEHKQYAIELSYARCMMGRLDVLASNIQRHSCILIGCIFYDMV